MVACSVRLRQYFSAAFQQAIGLQSWYFWGSRLLKLCAPRGSRCRLSVLRRNRLTSRPSGRAKNARRLTQALAVKAKGRMHKSYIIGGAVGAGIVLAVAGLLVAAYHHEFSEADACKSTLQALTSPSGRYRAEMNNKTCKWGLGLAANPVSVKIEKLGKGGWFYSMTLEYDGLNGDQGLPAPTINWNGPNSLIILVHTQDTSGTLVRTSHELTVTRSYVGSSRS